MSDSNTTLYTSFSSSGIISQFSSLIQSLENDGTTLTSSSALLATIPLTSVTDVVSTYSTTIPPSPNFPFLSSTSTTSSRITTAVTTPTTTSNSDINKQSHSPGSALVTGLVVGIVTAALFIIAGLTWFILHRRRKRHRFRRATRNHDSVVEKAQLHSDDLKPPLHELIGTIPRRKSRVVGTLTELPVDVGREVYGHVTQACVVEESMNQVHDRDRGGFDSGGGGGGGSGNKLRR